MVRRARGFFDDFKDFALKGNVMDLAVAVIIGGAFGKIVTSFVEDIVMSGIINPILAKTGTGWRDLTIGTIKIGSFLGALLDFLLIAFVVFLAIRVLEKMKRKEEAVVEAPPDAAVVLQERLTDAIERLNQNLESR
jgi:large conductance mechanosensitive channel